MSDSVKKQTELHSNHSWSRILTDTEVLNPLGTEGIGNIELEICRECPHMEVRCLHTKTSWEHLESCDGKSLDQECTGCFLACQLCGADCT